MTERDGQPGQPRFPPAPAAGSAATPSSNGLAKHVAAVRSLGIASSIVPARVSRSRARYSLREVTRISNDREVVAPHHGHTPD